MRTVPAAPEMVEDNHVSRIPTRCLLAPTVPNPCDGSVEASLDAILQWNAEHPCAGAISTTFMERFCTSTN
jgi:hypothetical protein